MQCRLTCLLILLLVCSLTGCARKTLVVLMSNPDGGVGKVSVSTDAGSVAIDKARQATEVSGRDSQPEQPRVLSKEEVDETFAAALAGEPPQPEHFLFYFLHDSMRLTSESKERLPQVLAAITARDAHAVRIIGHTDRVGDRDYNYTLSLQRATALTNMLVDLGVEIDTIRTTSHGEENPLIQTADNVSEPRNRRVEVIVR